jgi:hypothetical protein
MTKTIQFNTKRPYNEHGQRIVATRHDSGLVTFTDHGRGIIGQFQMSDAIPASAFSKETVMARYDRGKYEMGLESMEDARNLNKWRDE